MKIQFLTSAKKAKIAFMMVLAFTLTNCNKTDDDPTPVQQDTSVNPLVAYLVATGFNEKTTTLKNSGDYEFGFSFIPTSDGKITAVVVKIPDANPALRITIWDKATASVLKTETVNYTTADVALTKSIDALNVTAGVEYMITFNSNDWYDHRRTLGANATYPILTGDIAITGYAYISGTAQTLPNISTLNYYAGDISFRFQKS